MSTHFNFGRTVWDEPATCHVNATDPADATLYVKYGPIELTLCEPEDARSLIAVLAKGVAEQEAVRAAAVAERAGEQARAAEAEQDAAAMLAKGATF